MRSAILITLAAVAVGLGAVPPAAPDIGVDGPARFGKAFRDCSQCPEMVEVTPGSFIMGARSPGVAADLLVRPVRFAHRFGYGKSKVSFRDWKHCVLAGHCHGPSAVTGASLDPVVLVAWVEVQQYLAWLSLETGVEYRLLSEAEWEYLASGSGAFAPGFPVDGLEWTSDCWHEDYRSAPSDGSSWDKDGDCRYHVARGRRPNEANSAIGRRYRMAFDARDPALGFRVARTLND